LEMTMQLGERPRTRQEYAPTLAPAKVGEERPRFDPVGSATR
jgi:hypothetical protein